MKLLQITGTAVCIVCFLAGQAQHKIKNKKTKFAPPAIVQYEDTSIQSEKEKDKYKSEQWHQGDEIAAEKPTPVAGKKTRRLHKMPPPLPTPHKPDNKD